MKLYGLWESGGLRPYKIVECEILKETQKTYLIKLIDYPQTVKKSEMYLSGWGIRFFCTYEEALTSKKELLRLEISLHQKEIKKCEELLAEVDE